MRFLFLLSKVVGNPEVHCLLTACHIPGALLVLVMPVMVIPVMG